MNQEIINQALQKYGDLNQINQCIEELAELIVEINKYKRGYFNRNEITSEMADVLICFEYLKKVLAIDELDIKEQIEYKLERLKYRMGEH